MGKHRSLPMIRANLAELLILITFWCIPLLVCLAEIIGSESSSNVIQHTCVMFSIFSYQLTAQIFANMFNNSTQRLAAVATSASPLSDPRDNPFSSIYLRVLSVVLGLTQLFERFLLGAGWNSHYITHHTASDSDIAYRRTSDHAGSN